VVTAQGRPVSVRVGGLGGGVVDLAGPYRVVGEWWGDEPFARDEFDVATTDGALLRVFFDRLEHRWYADGYYD
jgi:protein ImuB